MPRNLLPSPPRAFIALPGRLATETRPLETMAPSADGMSPKIFFAIAVPEVCAMPLTRPDTR